MVEEKKKTGSVKLDSLLNFLSERIGCSSTLRVEDGEIPGGAVVTPDSLGSSVLVCTGLEKVKNSNAFLGKIKVLLDRVPLGLITARGVTPDRMDLMLKKNGLNPQFSGWLQRGQRTAAADSSRISLALVQPDQQGEGPPLPEFRVLAVMTVYNEEDIIYQSALKLYNQDIDVYVIDNWSTDSTYQIVQKMQNKGIITGSERFPGTDPGRFFELQSLLHRVEEVTTTSSADWFVFLDVDEIRVSPWLNLNLKEALHLVDRMNYNAVDHTVVVFHPVDNGFAAGMDLEDYFRYFEFSRRPGHFRQIKAWKNQNNRIDLASSGGHQLHFPGMRIFPYKFLLKHYPIRSQQHGERKIFDERKARWSPVERKMGWHVHYDSIKPGHSFITDPGRFLYFANEKEFNQDYLVERISGIGIR